MTSEKKVSAKRETEDDLRKEAGLLDHFCKMRDIEWKKLGNGAKYRIDAVLLKGKDVVGWAEVKNYDAGLFLGLNVQKYIEGCALAQETEKPFLFIFSHNRRVGYLKVHGGGAYSDLEKRLKYCGGTPKGRMPLPDDIEPMFLFDEKDVRWLS